MDDTFGEIKLRRRFITDTQRQQVGKALRQAGFGRDDFDWEERRSEGEKTEFIILAIVHKERGYYYAFDFTDGGGHRMERHPGESESVDYRLVGSWDEQYRGFLEWVNLLKKNLAVTDWWDDIEPSAGSIAGEPPSIFSTRVPAKIRPPRSSIARASPVRYLRT